MSVSRAKMLVRRALSKASPLERSEALRHLEWMDQLDLDQIDDLMRTDEGMSKLRGPLAERTTDVRGLPRFDEVVVATPGRMSPVELARVLSGGTRRKARAARWRGGPI